MLTMVKTFTLSENGVKECLKELENYCSNLDTKVEKFCEELAKIGVNTASTILSSDERAQGDTVSWTRGSGHEYLVVATGEQVAFIEFGVGVVGQSGGYPAENLPANWQYNAMWSPWAHDLQDPDRWYYYDEAKQVHSTKGSLPVGFMNSASENMRQRVSSIARQIFAQ